jgi:hypothetical protein
MHRVAPCRLCGGDDVRDPEVAVRSGGWADAHGLVGKLDVERFPVRRRVDRHRLDSQLVQRADHADGDLASVRDEDAREHRAS